MHKLPSALAAIGAAGVLAVAGPAFAAGSYTVTAGGQSSGTTEFGGASGQIAFNTSGGLNFTCDSGRLVGTLLLGHSDGIGVAEVTNSSFDNCVGPLGLPVTTTHESNWRVSATGDPGAVTDKRVDQIAVHVTNPDGQCDFDVTGTVVGNFDSTNQQFNVTGGDVLTLSNVSGCFGLINEGDTADLVATYDIVTDAGPIAITE